MPNRVSHVLLDLMMLPQTTPAPRTPRRGSVALSLFVTVDLPLHQNVQPGRSLYTYIRAPPQIKRNFE